MHRFPAVLDLSDLRFPAWSRRFGDCAAGLSSAAVRYPSCAFDALVQGYCETSIEATYGAVFEPTYLAH